MPRDNTSALVRCPFYRFHARSGLCKSVTCEWVGGRMIRQDFKTTEARAEYMAEKCCRGWEKCLVAAVMLRVADKKGEVKPKARKRKVVKTVQKVPWEQIGMF